MPEQPFPDFFLQLTEQIQDVGGDSEAEHNLSCSTGSPICQYVKIAWPIRER